MSPDAAAFQPLVFEDGALRARFRSAVLPARDLFSDIDRAVARFAAGEGDRIESGQPGSLLAFEVAPRVVVTVDPYLARPAAVQTFLERLSCRRWPESSLGDPAGHAIDAATGLTLWAPPGSPASQDVRAMWREIEAVGVLDPLEASVTPRLYGNKLRLTNFIAGVVEAVAEPDAPVLDLMAGTGIVARALSQRRVVTTNDGNPYAAVFARSQGLSLSETPTRLLQALQPAYQSNHDRLSSRLMSALEREAAFLHGDADAAARHAYAAFLAEPVLPITSGGEDVFRLVAERYANVYFGVAQAVEIDSLRAAIEAFAPEAGATRDLLLAALMLAVTTCASGPHFAQPNKPNAERSMQLLIERRARSVAWEFDLALTRLAARAPPRLRFAEGSCLDWREALANFAKRHRGAPAVVYVDPPYSKLQYSRYYHVLNVLLAYDYPEISGAGRYPPRASRLSSRFEYQQGSARREFDALAAAVAAHGFTLLISYGERGFVPAEELAVCLAGHFSRVTTFSDRIRHHSQGRVLGRSASVIEYVFVGRA